MSKPLIIISGGSGQLGNEFRHMSTEYSSFDFQFPDRLVMDLENPGAAADIIRRRRPAFFINCAAYTAVDKAETDAARAFIVNGTAVGELASACREVNTRMIHYSTDYVFEGSSSIPYTETDKPAPINVYGASKLEGERLCLTNNPDSIIIRTSWVYASTGHNFVRTMIRLLSDRKSINVVNDQIGSPTWAADIAKATMHIVSGTNWVPGIYHYSNQGAISWYDFAREIRSAINADCEITPIPTSAYPTPARRPPYSLLDTNKITSTYSLVIPGWKESLLACMKEIQNG